MHSEVVIWQRPTCARSLCPVARTPCRMTRLTGRRARRGVALADYYTFPIRQASGGVRVVPRTAAQVLWHRPRFSFDGREWANVAAHRRRCRASWSLAGLDRSGTRPGRATWGFPVTLERCRTPARLALSLGDDQCAPLPSKHRRRMPDFPLITTPSPSRLLPAPRSSLSIHHHRHRRRRPTSTALRSRQLYSIPDH